MLLASKQNLLDSYSIPTNQIYKTNSKPKLWIQPQLKCCGDFNSTNEVVRPTTQWVLVSNIKSTVLFHLVYYIY